MKPFWYCPPWTQTAPWAFRCFRGGDEFWRATLAIQLPFLGMLVIADPRAGLTDEEFQWLYEKRQQCGVAAREDAW